MARKKLTMRRQFQILLSLLMAVLSIFIVHAQPLVARNIAAADTLKNEISSPEYAGNLTATPYDCRLDFGREYYWGGPGYRDVKVLVYLSSSVEISSIHFNVLFDNSVFTASRVDKTRSVFSEFDWHPFEEGVSITMSDSSDFLPALLYGRIAYIYFDIDSNASERKYDLFIDNIVVLDTSGIAVPSTADKAGEFYVGWPVLKVIDGQGASGSSENLVQVDMENRFFVGSMMFYLLFDTDYLSVLDVTRTDRTDDVSIFSWAQKEGGITIVMAPFIPINPGTGPIADIFFSTDERAPTGVYELKLLDVEIADIYGLIEQVHIIDGTFHVLPPPGDVNGDGLLSVEDVIIIVNIMIRYLDPTQDQQDAADVNGDGAINVLDVVSLVDMILEP